MSLQDAFCVECGAEDVALTDGVCLSCRLGDRPLLKALREEVQVEVCKQCGAERRGDSWRRREDATAAYDRAVMEALQVHEAVEDPSFELIFEHTAPQTLAYEARMTGWVDEEAVQDAVEVRVAIQPGICRNCSRQAGGYYEAVLQIRPPKELDDHVQLQEVYAAAMDDLHAMREGGREQAFVTKVEEVHGGYDIYVGELQAARQIAKSLSEEFGAETGEAHEQVGQEDGQPVMRTSVSVRLPPYAVGDFVEREDALWRVEGFTKRLVSLRRCPDGHREHVDAHAETLRRVLPRTAVESAVVVSRGQGEAQVLDPDTMETVPIAVPTGEIGEELDVVRWEGELVAVPA